MKYIYEIIDNSLTGSCIRATDENGQEFWIPMDEANSDYQAYLDRDNPKAALSTPIVSSDE